MNSFAVLALVFIALLVLWVVCITALDLWDEYDRKKERDKKLWSIDE